MKKKVRILIASKNPAKLKAVESAFREYFKDIEITGEEVKNGVSDTPLTGKETLKGVKNRIKQLDKVKGFDFKVAIEAGTDIFLHRRYLSTLVMIKKGDKESFGKSSSYPLPDSVSKALERREHLSEIAEKLSGEKNIRSKGGFVEFLSKGNLIRSSLTRDAVICALFPFINEKIYKHDN